MNMTNCATVRFISLAAVRMAAVTRTSRKRILSLLSLRFREPRRFSSAACKSGYWNGNPADLATEGSTRWLASSISAISPKTSFNANAGDRKNCRAMQRDGQAAGEFVIRDRVRSSGVDGASDGGDNSARIRSG